MSAAFVAVVFFFVCAIVLTAVGLGLKYLEAERQRNVTKVLGAGGSQEIVQQESMILLDENKNEVSIARMIADLPAMKTLERYLQQGGLTWTPIGVVSAMAILAVIGVFLGMRINVPVFREFAILAFGGLLGYLPYAWVLLKRKRRLAEFEEQFPEALDFLARSMRAGHAFSVSLEMMSDEAPDPLGIEFRQVFNEQNLGAPVETALRNLADRVPLLDVRFFVSAVMMQRETGGNLAEILTKLAFVIRERFRLKGQVKAVSAHGRMTALILSVMPLVTMLALMIIAPGYLSSMAEDIHGKFMIVGAIAGQFLGYMWMRKIINIKV
jgi:tight adherence protein B